VDLLDYFKRSLVEKAIKYGLVLSPEVLDALLYYEGNIDDLFRRLSQKGVTLVESKHLNPEEPVPSVQRREESTLITNPEPTCEPKIRISLYIDPDELEPPNWEKEREKMLRERLEFLRPLIASRGLVAADYDRAMRSEEEKTIIGLVLKKEVNGNGKTMIYIEDGENSTILLSPGTHEIETALRFVDQDMVVGFVVKGVGKALIIEDVLWPQIPSYSPEKGCPFRLLVIPFAYRHNIERLLQEPHDAVILLSNVVNAYSVNPQETYRRIDEIISSLEEPVFVVPGPEDLVRAIPPHPPHDETLFPNASGMDNITLLGSPAIVRIGPTSLLLYDGGYYRKTGAPIEELIYSRLIQPNISSFPYRSSRDYSLLKKLPDYVLSPVGGRKKRIGPTTLLVRDKPYILNLSTGEVKYLG
jgi:hypothetical protein